VTHVPSHSDKRKAEEIADKLLFHGVPVEDNFTFQLGRKPLILAVTYRYSM
jgi:hypothetical protein